MTGAEAATPSRGLESLPDRREPATRGAQFLKALLTAALAAGIAWGVMKTRVENLEAEVAAVKAGKADAAVVAEQQRAILRELDELHRMVERIRR